MPSSMYLDMQLLRKRNKMWQYLVLQNMGCNPYSASLFIIISMYCHFWLKLTDEMEDLNSPCIDWAVASWGRTVAPWTEL